MKILIFGGSFNPPHLGHVNAAASAYACFQPDKFYIIPACTPPHKAAAAGIEDVETRLSLCKLAFSEISDRVEVSDVEIRRGGKSYTSDTIRQLKQRHPGAELIFLMGTDMLLTVETWHEADYLLKEIEFGVFPRNDGEIPAIEKKCSELKRTYGTEFTLVPCDPFSAASSAIRKDLSKRNARELLSPSVYAEIIRLRLYGAKPEYQWLREQAYAMLKPGRIPHVKGCEQEAVSLAERWGADREDAAEAAILHDITKKLSLPEQLKLCEEYGIIPDYIEAASEKLLHAKTGAFVAKDRFGINHEVFQAICRHTTGTPDMNLLQQIIYMADYIEPTRDFDGVEELRTLAYSDLTAAMILGLEMSLEDVKCRGNTPHPNTLDALAWFQKEKE